MGHDNPVCAGHDVAWTASEFAIVAAPIEFYFEFASPYGYLASLRIDAIAAAYDREVTWQH